MAQQRPKTLTLEGQPSSIGYLEYLPPGYETSEKKFPVLIFLHGSGESGGGSQQVVTSVEDQGSNVVSVRPNPVSDDKTYLVYADESARKGPISIWSVTGVKLIDLPAGTLEINTAGWKSGVYILQMVDPTGFVTTERVIKTY